MICSYLCVAFIFGSIQLQVEIFGERHCREKVGTCHCFLNNRTQLFTEPSSSSVISHLDMILDIREAVCGFYQILCYFI